MTSSNSVSAPSSGAAGDLLRSYARRLRARAADISASIAKLNLRTPGHHWPVYLQRFSVLSAQLQALYDELFSIDATDGGSFAARHFSETALLEPITSKYNPGITLRIKPILELEQQEQAWKQQAANSSVSSASPSELESRINSYNLELVDFIQSFLQYQSLLIPRDMNAVQAIGVGSTSGHVKPTKQELAQEDQELQRALSYMFTGKLLRDSTPAAQAPPTAPTSTSAALMR